MEKQVVEAPLASEKVTVDVLAILNRRRGWLVLSCILGLAVGAAYFFLSTKRYESRAELLLMQNESDPIAYGSDRNISEELLATHMKLVQSPRIAAAALQVTPEAAKKLAVMEPVSEEASANKKVESLLENSSSLFDEVTAGKGIQSAAPASSGEFIQGLSPAEALQQKQSEPTATNSFAPEAKVDAPIANTPAVTAPAITAPGAIQGSEPAAAPTASSGNEIIAGVSPDSQEHQAPEGAQVVEDTESSKLLVGLPSIVERLSEELINGDPRKRDAKVADYVVGNLNVTTGGSGRARNAHVLNIAFRHTNPNDCELITRSVVHHYREFVKYKFKDINTEAAGLISQAKLELEEQIKKLESEYRAFRQDAPMLTRGLSGTDVHTARYEELSAELSQLQIKRDEAAGRLDMVSRTLKELSGTGAHNLEKLSLIDQQNAERLGILVTVERGKAETAAFQSTQPERMAGATAEYGQLLTMKTRLSQLTADFGPEYPEVKSLRQQIAEMEGILSKKSKALAVGDDVQLTPDDVMRAYVSMLKNDLHALEQRGKDVERQIEREIGLAKELIEYQLKDEGMIRERQRTEQLYDAVIQRLRDINMKEDQSPLILELIKEPAVGEVVEPKRIIAAALAMVCALLIGGVGVLVAELSDRSVHTPKEFEEMLGSRVLSHLPNFQNDPEVRRIQRQSRKLKSPLSPTLLTFYAPDSRASEAFRALRTQVMFAAGGDHRILVTTSASQGAGKSMLSSNMAVSMASIGAEVLLIDCDMRLPQVHRLFGVPNDMGLADAIANPDKVDEYLKSSSVPGLTLLTSGQSPANPAELLSRPECKELLEKLRSRFSYIIVDCPPVLAVSDPSIVAPYADGVLFVTMVDGESRPKTERSKRILEGVGTKILGIVVNRSDESAQRYGYQAYGYENNSEEGGYYAARPVR